MYRYTRREPPVAGRRPTPGAYRRDQTTWAAFGALFAFGLLNAVLGPALPYIRAAEGISYLLGSLHQVAFALGGGLAGILAAHARRPTSRATLIAAGLTGAAIAGLALGYGATPAITTVSATLMSLLATSALIRLWAVLADVHGAHRAVAMTEGEVSVSLAGIVTPLLIGMLAATALSWRFAFVCGAATAGMAALWVVKAPMPPSVNRHSRGPNRTTRSTHRRPQPTLIVVFAIVALEFTLSFWLASYLNDDIGLARGTAVAAVSGLYAANLAGRLLASRLARRTSAEALLAGALATALFGLPFLLGATDAPVAAIGIVVAGIGIGATFPLISAVHIKISLRDADGALGQVLAVASMGQIVGPLATGTIAQASGLRTGLLVLPALVVIAAAGLEPARRASRRCGIG